MESQMQECLRPANIFWRLLQGMLDDAVVTSAALALSSILGFLPTGAHFTHARAGFASLIEAAYFYLSIAAQVGVILIIYAIIKFFYYFGFIAYVGQTPACRLLRLRVVMTNGDPVSTASSLKRALAGGILSQAPVVGQFLRIADYLAALLNRRKQAVRDMVAGTMLIHDTSSLQPGTHTVGGTKNG